MIQSYIQKFVDMFVSGFNTTPSKIIQKAEEDVSMIYQWYINDVSMMYQWCQTVQRSKLLKRLLQNSRKKFGKEFNNSNLVLKGSFWLNRWRCTRLDSLECAWLCLRTMDYFFCFDRWWCHSWCNSGCSYCNGTRCPGTRWCSWIDSRLELFPLSLHLLLLLVIHSLPQVQWEAKTYQQDRRIFFWYRNWIVSLLE